MNKAIIIAVSLAVTSIASANEVFENNCSACHKDGGNIINSDKTLSKEHLKANGFDTVAAVKKIVSEGKSPMPKFSATLDEKQIDDVANYVIKQSEKGW